MPPVAGLPVEDQRLVLSGQDLADDECLSKAGVLDAATLQVLGRLLGGAKKRKKKTYTKPKKIKHKHKKVKLRILKYYKVSAPPALCQLCSRCDLEMRATSQLEAASHRAMQRAFIKPAGAGGRLWEGAAPAQDLPQRGVRTRHLHGYTLQPCVLVCRCSSLYTCCWPVLMSTCLLQRPWHWQAAGLHPVWWKLSSALRTEHVLVFAVASATPPT